jgi:5-amino-6-(5-phosphoribosylamino)uracil reductase
MPERPYVLLSAAASADGFIDDATSRRLILSDAADLDRVDEVRAGADAILVGAGTVRADDPRLLVRSPERRAARLARGAPASPARVVLAASGDLNPAARFLTAGFPASEPATQAGPASQAGYGDRIVYAAGPGLARARQRLTGTGAIVADAGGGLAGILADLAARGIRRLLVEGGTGVLSAFLVSGLCDEMHLVIAPFLVGSGARLTAPGAYPWHPGRPMRLAGVTRIGDAVLLRYLLPA